MRVHATSTFLWILFDVLNRISWLIIGIRSVANYISAKMSFISSFSEHWIWFCSSNLPKMWIIQMLCNISGFKKWWNSLRYKIWHFCYFYKVDKYYSWSRTWKTEYNSNFAIFWHTIKAGLSLHNWSSVCSWNNTTIAPAFDVLLLFQRTISVYDNL